MDLNSMKYAELQSIAKELGLKANMKAEKLLKAISQHYQQENMRTEEQEQEEENSAKVVKEDENAGKEAAQENNDVTGKTEVSSAALFVNTRRGRGNGTKRKITDEAAVTDCDAKLLPSAAKGETEVANPGAASGTRHAKKRKVSSAKDSDKAEPPVSTQATGDEQQLGTEENAPKVVKGGKIPRYQPLQQNRKVALKPVTPNFKKLHEAHFNKMESIDSYVQRKNKKIETYRSSVQELKKHSDKTKLQQADGKTQVKANQSRASMFSPVAVTKKVAEEKRRHTLLSASKVPAKKDASFKPSVLSTRRITVRFSEATQDNEHKRSLVKTPARMSPCVMSSTPQKETTQTMKPNNVKTSTLSATKSPKTFIFTGNTSTSTTPGTQKKPSFNLKASLSRPLNYKPHKGKLKPFGETRENTTPGDNLISNSHQKNYKQHQVQTREDRRAKRMEDRKQKKESMLGARRGLVMMQTALCVHNLCKRQ
ncbi:nucleolar and spindle-associated protein 1 isoform X1 [Mastacembelus armatus]|uniref:nucleolar and spindle-associated protein 1 isoform X1 n=1 Tax=Mastacembelus armatus TaxID=205130 RepID=UPI000E4601B0|nr:nucleolar and spindle-associated protein 1 isoform X1 [Mastacembelus armatus]